MNSFLLSCTFVVICLCIIYQAQGAVLPVSSTELAVVPLASGETSIDTLGESRVKRQDPGAVAVVDDAVHAVELAVAPDAALAVDHVAVAVAEEAAAADAVDVDVDADAADVAEAEREDLFRISESMLPTRLSESTENHQLLPTANSNQPVQPVF
ncbi:unnamed protein product [Caenorhabditis bovis]|uniref:Uncharacterized protein n=1 Tax=Caenorhabditis bovis TaxID=2654633 RepID=A0A8S1EKK8_9PELO|nr:unnamed protein product [Caenorhabditis bovis]